MWGRRLDLDSQNFDYVFSSITIDDENNFLYIAANTEGPLLIGQNTIYPQTYLFLTSANLKKDSFLLFLLLQIDTEKKIRVLHLRVFFGNFNYKIPFKYTLRILQHCKALCFVFEFLAQKLQYRAVLF
jgi:hypothetical protein